MTGSRSAPIGGDPHRRRAGRFHFSDGANFIGTKKRAQIRFSLLRVSEFRFCCDPASLKPHWEAGGTISLSDVANLSGTKQRAQI